MMDEEGLATWLANETGLFPGTVQDICALCRQVESVLPSEFGGLDAVVADDLLTESASHWLIDHAEEYILEGEASGARNRVWALRKYAAFRASRPKAFRAGA